MEKNQNIRTKIIFTPILKCYEKLINVCIVIGFNLSKSMQVYIIWESHLFCIVNFHHETLYSVAYLHCIPI